jgi:predicted hydrocarbon binding protein
MAACLHEAIADRLPQRIEFYEHWLHSDGLRDGNIGLAPISAVIGFLRTEGEGYDAVMTRAGELAAAWTVASLAPWRRRSLTWLPRRLRVRAALRIAAGIVHDLHSASRASARVRRSRARLEVRSSLFCSVREAHTSPLCGFYLAVTAETLQQFGIAAVGRVEQCRAVGASTCLVVLELASADKVSEPAVAA